MNDSNKNSDNMMEAKKFSLQFKIDALQQLILLRYQSLITISSISFAVIGLTITLKSEYIKNQILAYLALVLFVVIAFISLGRYLYLLRRDIDGIAQKIEKLPDEDRSQSLEKKEFKVDYWPEALYMCLVISAILFVLSLVNNHFNFAFQQVSKISNIDPLFFLEVVGICLNVAGTIVLAIPLLQVKKDIDDDEIIDDHREDSNGEEKYYYTKRGFIKDKNLGLLGLGLLGLGFMVQFFLVLL
ncbi:MAG: hypothetical protein WC788_08525 [Candidatus Paceibacterota bacterium]|jgi:cell division protein FtsL